jgi:hypothetical protein
MRMWEDMWKCRLCEAMNQQKWTSCWNCAKDKAAADDQKATIVESIVAPAPPNDSGASVGAGSGPKALGGLLTFVGVGLAAFAVFGFDVSVPAGYLGIRVNNIGLMAHRQNMLIGACALGVIGVLVLLFSPRSSALGGAQAGNTHPTVEKVAGPTESFTPAAAPNLSEQLIKLAELHQSGFLTDQEFSSAKGRLLNV